LSKLSTENYIRDPRFQAHGAAIKWKPDEPARWYDERFLREVLKNEDWSDVFLIAHHQQFDGFILSHHYKIVPAVYGCTLSMARLVLGNHIGVGLDSVRTHFGLSTKKTPYNLFKGKRWAELDQAIQMGIAEGACDEVESIWKIFCELMKEFPRSELEIIDETIRMFTVPVLRADTDMLAALWESEAVKKKDALTLLGVTEYELQSADKFKALLKDEGVEIEYKEGGERKNGKREQIPAFAKTDDFMRGLLEHDNPRVRALAEGRLGVKSTLLQTRAETLGFMASRGALPVYLRYAGAHTTRWSGGDRCNWQNFKRGSDIRKAIMAPEGWLLGVIDLSQIECRILDYVAGQEDELEKFRRGQDPYIGIASEFYNRVITKKDEKERGTGKQAILSCGYGCGPEKFQKTAALGFYGPPVELSLEQAKKAVKLYRDSHPFVVKYWREADDAIVKLANGEVYQWGPLRVEGGKIYLPNSAPLDYTTLEFYTDPNMHEEYWRIKNRHGFTKLYGAKLVENVVQALARVVLSDAMLRIRHRGFRTVMCTHDEVVILIEADGHSSEALGLCMEEMKLEPTWLPGIPLDCEATIGERYSK
jgi:DNA polymerase